MKKGLLKKNISNYVYSYNTIHCNGVVLEIYLDHKFQWPQEGLNYEYFAYEVSTV